MRKLKLFGTFATQSLTSWELVNHSFLVNESLSCLVCRLFVWWFFLYLDFSPCRAFRLYHFTRIQKYRRKRTGSQLSWSEGRRRHLKARVLVLFVFEMALIMYPWLAWNLLCSPGWPDTQMLLPSAGINGVGHHTMCLLFNAVGSPPECCQVDALFPFLHHLFSRFTSIVYSVIDFFSFLLYLFGRLTSLCVTLILEITQRGTGFQVSICS